MPDAVSATQLAQTPGQILIILVTAGLMGILEQGARTVGGLKGMADDAKTLNMDPSELFQAARLLISLLIGLIVGLAAGLIFIGSGATDLDWKHLLGSVAAGYSGTDFLEGFISTYLGSRSAVTTALAARITRPRSAVGNYCCADGRQRSCLYGYQAYPPG